jgi:hypothetical protein
MSRPGRWARSTLDYRAHLLWPEGHHLSGVLLARCGEAHSPPSPSMSSHHPAPGVRTVV